MILMMKMAIPPRNFSKRARLHVGITTLVITGLPSHAATELWRMKNWPFSYFIFYRFTPREITTGQYDGYRWYYGDYFHLFIW
jgi:hypothetical protein